MNHLIESFFDKEEPGFKLWSKKVSDLTINPEEVIFEGFLFKINRETNKKKKRYFVLTKKKLYYLKSKDSKKIRGAMDLDWVRVEYFDEDDQQGKQRHCIRFVRNMKFSDFIIEDEKQFEQLQTIFATVFLQSNFHIKFNAIKMIGKGSFARVYLVEDKKTMLKFAVKAFSKEYLLSQKKGKESLINEINIMKNLDHQNIMKLYELHESKNSIYLVMELLEGGELFSIITDKKKITMDSVRQVMRCLFQGLAYLAKNDIMHRDLKPENMILKEKNSDLSKCTLKLVDFGLSSYCNIDEYLFKRCGTPGYVAPEIINSSSKKSTYFDPKVDVFSAGIIFYILLVGHSPFNGKSFQEILEQNKLSKINFNSTKLEKVPLAKELLQKCLLVDPNKRISAKEALQHKFLNNSDNTEIDFNSEKLKNINANLSNPDDNSSFVVRENVINGKLDTINDSNSKGGIQSFRGAKKPSTKQPRPSIYKTILKNSLKSN